MARMNKAEREAFLAEPRVAVLSIPQQGLGPLSSPVWFDYEPGGVIWFLIQSTSRKGELLAPGQRVSLCMQRETRPYAYVSVEGPVVALEPYSLDDDLAPMAIRYLGEEAGAAYADGMRERHAKGNSLKITVSPENWRTVDYAK